MTRVPFHVTNRGVDRRTLFRRSADYRLFLQLMTEGKQRAAVRVFGLCLMPNHFHAVVQGDEDKAISAYFHWVQGCYACHLRTETRSRGNGHVFQQRFWTDLIQDDWHFRNVLRYVEHNPVASQLVDRAEQWPWSSLYLRQSGHEGLLDRVPVALGRDWIAIVNEARPPDEGD